MRIEPGYALKSRANVFQKKAENIFKRKVCRIQAVFLFVTFEFKREKTKLTFYKKKLLERKTKFRLNNLTIRRFPCTSMSDIKSYMKIKNDLLLPLQSIFIKGIQFSCGYRVQRSYSLVCKA